LTTKKGVLSGEKMKADDFLERLNGTKCNCGAQKRCKNKRNMT